MLFLLLIDEATRYKVIALAADRSCKTLLQLLLHTWIRYFGPMRVLVSDQEGALMSLEAAAEFDRLSICRRPKGAGERHTGTGLVERHIALSKAAYLKTKAELERQALEHTPANTGAEVGMAQNVLLSFGGYTPSMAVLGTNPRSFYEIEDKTLSALTATLEGNYSVFEHALRLRQIACAAVTQSIAESRIARANRTRPHVVDTAT